MIKVNKIRNILRRKYTKTEAISIIFLIVAIGLIIDIFRGSLNIFLIALSIFLIAIGFRQLKKKNSFTAYILIIIGSGFLLSALISSFSFTLIFATLIIYNSYQLFRSSSNKSHLPVNIKSNPLDSQDYIQTSPYFKNKLIAEYRDFKHSYALEDINIQTGFGDISIDLSDTIIPQGESVILIRGVIGSIYLNIPSDIGISVQASLLCGKINLLKTNKTVFNMTHKYQSVGYKDSYRKIKVVVSLLVGDIEVTHR